MDGNKLTEKRYRGVIFVSVSLLVFFVIYSKLLFFGTERFLRDTFASYSNFYYAMNCFKNGTFPLWDPYTHAGQPFYYQFVKFPTGELSALFFGMISRISDVSYLMLYNYHYTLHFLIFAFGCFYLARVIFTRRVIAYYVLFLCLFNSLYSYLLMQEAAIQVLEFLPWLMAFFIKLVTGKGRAPHLFALVLVFLLYIQEMDFLVSFYFFLVFCVLFCVLLRNQLSRPKIHHTAYFLAVFLLCVGLLKTLVLLSEIKHIFPSIRIPDNSIILSSPSHQAVFVYIREYLTMLNPLVCGSALRLYLGLIPTFLLFYALALRRDKFIWILAVPAALSIWVSLGPQAGLSAICYYLVPLFNLIREIMHFIYAPIYISFVFISAFGLESLLEKAGSLHDWRRFWDHIERYLWVFIVGGLALTVAYIYRDRKSPLESFIALSYYVIPVVGIWLGYLVKGMQKYLKKSQIRTIGLSIATLFAGIAIAIFSQPFFNEHLGLFGVNRLIPVLTAFYIVAGYILFYPGKKFSSAVIVFCFGLAFIDLVFFTALPTYSSNGIPVYRVLGKVEGITVPERAKPFEYQDGRKEYFWPAEIDQSKVTLLRPPMLYLQSSVMSGKEYDFYTLKEFWAAYQRFPQKIKRMAMGADMPKLGFFTRYKEMDDEAVFKECETLDPQALSRTLYLAPDSRVLTAPPQSGNGTRSAGMEVTYFDNNRLGLIVEAKENGFLYYSDGYDKQWRCFVDGKPEIIRRANIAFKAVFINAGRHSVLFMYRPYHYLVSLWMFLAACGICFIAACWSRKERVKVG